MPFTYAAHVGGSITEPNKQSETLYLLDRELQVVGVRRASPRSKALPVGTYFFDRYVPFSKDVALLSQLFGSGSETALLISTDKGPVLLITALSRRTGLFLAAVPHGPLRQLLLGAHRFADVFLAENVFISQALTAPLQDAQTAYERIRAWLDGCRAPFLGESTDPLITLTRIATELAALCGCTLEYDLGALTASDLAGLDSRLLTGALLSVMLLAARLSKERRLLIRAVLGDGGEPKLRLSFRSRQKAPKLTELLGFTTQAAWLGELFSSYHDASDPTLLHVLFDICSKEISVQEVKLPDYFQKSTPLGFYAE